MAGVKKNKPIFTGKEMTLDDGRKIGLLQGEPGYVLQFCVPKKLLKDTFDIEDMQKNAVRWENDLRVTEICLSREALMALVDLYIARPEVEIVSKIQIDNSLAEIVDLNDP